MDGVPLKKPLKGLYRAFTLADGSCFFHSLAAILDKDNYSLSDWKARRKIGLRLRKELVNPKAYEKWVRANGYEGFGGLSTQDACDPSVYADDLLIAFCAERLGLSLVLIRNKSEAYVRGVSNSDRTPVALIAYVNNNHFEPILRCEGAPRVLALTHQVKDTLYATHHLHSARSPYLESLCLLR